MCLYPTLMRNKKYDQNTKKNRERGITPKLYDKRLEYVAVGCQQCEECRKKKANEWRVRLQEEIKYNRGKFVTLTFSEEAINKLEYEYSEENMGEIPDANTVATMAMRKFLERWRAKYGKSVHHWLITELGDEETERIHMHGILFTTEDNETIDKIWKYGKNYYGYSCNAKTINYCIKYVMKIDKKHPKFKQKILCSKGIGKGYINTWSAEQNQYNRWKGHEETTRETYRLSNGAKTALPIYYRNKIYTEREREKLWIEKLNKGIRYIHGKKYEYKTEADIKYFENELYWFQIENERKGYKPEIKWDTKKYRARVEKLNKFTYDTYKKDNTMIKMSNVKQQEFEWWNDRKYIDVNAESKKEERKQRKIDWIKKNLIKK